MYFDSFAHLWAMDGHGAFVWSAYAISSIVLGLVVRGSMVRRSRLLQRVRSRIDKSQGEG